MNTILTLYHKWLTLDGPLMAASACLCLLLGGIWLGLSSVILTCVWKDRGVLLLLVPLLAITVVICLFIEMALTIRY